ncbi:MAG: helix-turn-helix transcriptional regulator [Victivallales bacterium]|nr:helix-turn-helix transcriptional regulator [Victivallales bacterium]
MTEETKTAFFEPSYFSSQVEEATRFYRSPIARKGAAIYVVAGGREECAPGYEISRRTFPFYSIEFVASGKGRLELANEKFSLSPGTIFSYGPGIEHRITTFESSPLQKHFVNFAGRAAKKTLLATRILGKVLFSSEPNQILDSFNEITRYGLSQSSCSEEILSGLVKLLTLKIADTAIRTRDIHSASFGTYQRCIRIIAERHSSLLTMSEMASRCNVDPAYLCRLFRRFGNQSPYQHLLKAKMNRAAELLLSPGAMVKEVATGLGFDDQFHFSRSFKRCFGVPPTEFVRLHQSHRKASSADKSR